MLQNLFQAGDTPNLICNSIIVNFTIIYCVKFTLTSQEVFKGKAGVYLTLHYIRDSRMYPGIILLNL